MLKHLFVLALATLGLAAAGCSNPPAGDGDTGPVDTGATDSGRGDGSMGDAGHDGGGVDAGPDMGMLPDGGSDAGPSCGANNGGCDPLVTCTQGSGTVTCGACPSGYSGTGTTGCTDIDECTTNNGGCDALATCTNTTGGRTCGTCPSGYSGTGDTACTDIDECATNNGGCDPLAACNNTAGSFTCGNCPTGYTGGGSSGCVDVDECATSNGGCAQTCTNGTGTFTCSCGAGYTLDADGVSCDDIDECMAGNGGCAQMCMNLPGTRVCSCGAGYTLAADGMTCNDVNECAMGNGGCDAHATCMNTPGSRTCACNTGYTGNGLVCAPLLRDCAAILAATPTATSGNYPIAPDGTNAVTTYCDMATAGGGWTQIYDQNYGMFGNIRPSGAWTSVNTSTPNQGDYSILDQLPNLGNGSYYQLRYEWLDGPMPAGYVQWTQDQSPLTVGDASTRAALSGFTTSLSTTPAGCQPFSGLGISGNTAQTYLDGDQGGCWWWAVGVSVGHPDGITAIPTYNTPDEPLGNSARHVRVWVRPGVAPPVSCNALHTSNPSAPSGTYTIDIDGAGGAAPFSVTCDMTTAGGGWTVISSENFETGVTTGWSTPVTSTACAYTTQTLCGYNLCGAGASETKTFSLLGIPHTTARVSLDYYSIDSWDGEQGFVQVDGADIFRQAISQAQGSNRCGGGWNDRDAVNVVGTPAHSANSLVVTASSTLDQAASDESWSIDNVVVMIR